MDEQPASVGISAPSEAEKLAAPNTADDWHRLSPIAILYFAASSFKHLLSNIIYLIPALAFSYKSIMQHPFIWLPGIAAFIGFLTFMAFLSFKVYRYRLTDSNIEIRSGIFSKKHLNLPFTRVQNVKIEQPVYYRISGHACLQLDTAGSAKNEAKLVALKLEFAEQLKSQILSQSKTVEATSAEDGSTLQQQDIALGTTDGNQEKVINRRSLSDLIIHGITSNRIWIFMGGLAPFYDNIFQSSDEWLKGIGVDLKDLFNLETHSVLEVGLYALSLTMLFMLVLVTFSVIGSIMSFYGYTLSKLDDKYIRRSGLFTKHEVSMKLSRLQMIVRKQDWLDLLLKRINLKFEQNTSVGKNLDPSAASNKIIVPSIRPHECKTLIDDAYPLNTLNALIIHNGFEAISKRFILRNIMFIWLPIWLVMMWVTITNDNLILAAVSCGIFLFFCGLVTLRWKRWGIAKDENFIYIRKGLMGVDYHFFPTYKLQQTQFKQSVLMKRHQLASVKFVLASGAVQIPMIKQELARSLIDDGLYQVESSEKSWM